MKKIFLSLFLAFFANALTLPDEIAWYPLHDGEGTEAKEAYGRLAPIKITDSFWMTKDGLSLIDFSGMKNSRMALATLPPIEFDGEFTIAIWVSAYWWHENWGPICSRSDATYGLRNNQNKPGQLLFRVKDKNAKRGANLFSSTVLDRNVWYHVAAVFKPGQYLQIYINGQLDAERTENIPTQLAHDSEPFRMGRAGKNPGYAGVLSNLHLYKRALSQEEIAALYKSENRFGLAVSEESRLPRTGAVAATISGAEVLSGGALRIRSGAATFLLSTSCAYPAEPYMGTNFLAAAPVSGGEKEWRPTVKATANEATVSAHGAFYRLDRRIQPLSDGRIRIFDNVTNLTDEDQAFVFTHFLQSEAPLREWYLHGEENSYSPSCTPSCNPTGWFSCGDDALAWVVEDDIFRCHIESSVRAPKDAPASSLFGSRRIGIPAKGSHEFVFTLYPMKGDYFDFLNRLRKDWQVPVVTLPGPFVGFRTAAQRSEMYRNFAANPDAMKAFFQRRNARVFNLSPCYNYWDGTIFHTREEYKRHIQEAMRVIRASIPDAIFLVGLETIVYCLDEKEFTTPAPPDFSWKKATAGTRKRVLESPWRDSATLHKNGDIDLYPDTPVIGDVHPALYLMVHPLVGNHFFKRRLDEYAFLLDEVGLDGVYQDMFGYAGTVIHDRWDGFSVAVLPNGKIASRYAHLGPLTAPAREIWLKDILRRNKIALTNFGAPTTRNLQTIPYMNFCEAAGNGIGRQNLTAIPPDSSGCSMNQLSTPLAYGPHKSEECDATRLMARVRAYLRYGCLYIHTSARNYFPSEGAGSGEYGPINHSYPITPIELHRGWIKGKERIVSCVSYKTTWDRKEKPTALRFDENGRDMPLGDAATITGTPGNWQITTKIKDWKEFIILE